MGKLGERSFLKAEITPTKCDEEHSKNYFVTLELSMVGSALPSSTLFSKTSTLDSLCNLQNDEWVLYMVLKIWFSSFQVLRQ